MSKKELKAYIIAWIVCLLAIIAAVLLTVTAIANDGIEIQPEYIEITEGPESAEKALPELDDLGEFKLTFYCPGRCCNGKNAGKDCFGNKLIWGTVAVDPKVIPLKTHLIIDGFDMEFTARDVGDEWVQGKHIDIFVPMSHEEAAQMNDKYGRAKVWRVKE